MKRKFTILTAALALLVSLAIPMGMWGQTTYEQLTSIANIDESAQYVLGIDGTGFHYEGTSSWGKTALPSAQTPIYYTLTKATDGNSFTAHATISGTTYYLQIPTSNTFSMATSTGTNTDIIIGTTQVSGTNYAVANKTTTARHLRINGTSGLRSYAGTTGTMAFFYKVVTSSSNTYTVTFDAGDGTFVGNTDFPNTSNTKPAGTYNLPSATPATGYTFDGWTATGISTPITGSYTVSSNIEFTAQYTQNSGSGTVTATLTQSNLELTGSYSSNTSKTIDGITYVHTDLMKNNSNIQAKASTGTIKNTTAYPGDITSVAITHSETARATTINGSADGTNWTQVATGSGSITADFSGRGFKYFQITRGANAAYWTKVEITYSTSSSSQSQSDLAITGDPVALNFDLFNNNSAQTVSYTTSSTGAITISPASPTSYFSYVHDATAKTITVTPLAVTPSAQTVTIDQAADDDYYAGTATFTVSIVNSTPLANIAALTALTEAGTYNVALSNAVVTFVNGSNAYIQDASGAVAMHKSDHGLTAGDVLNGTATVAYQLYNGNPQITNLSGVTSASGTAPNPTEVAQSAWSYTFSNVLSQYFKVTGATITQSNNKYYVSLGGESIQLYKSGSAIGTLDLTKTYSITGFPTMFNSTKELQVYADPEVEVIAEPSVTVTPNTINAPAEGADGTLALAYENITDFVSFDYYFCDATGEALDEDPEWIYAAINEENDGYSLDYIIYANNDAARTAYLKVYTFDDNFEEVYAIVTINQAEFVIDYAELPFEWSSFDETPTGITNNGVTISNYLKFDTSSDNIILKFNERPGTLEFNVKGNPGNNGWAGTFKVQTSVDGVSYTDLQTYTELPTTEYQPESFATLDENVRYIKWVYTEKVSGNVAVNYIYLAAYEAPVASITVNPATVNVDATPAEGEDFIEGTLDLTWENLEITDIWNDFAIQYYDAEGEELTDDPDWIVVEFATQDPNIGEGYLVSYMIDVNEGEARTAYFKVFALGEEDYVYSNLVTITQAAPVTPAMGNLYALYTGDLVEGDYLIVYDGGAMNNIVQSDRLQYEDVTPIDNVITTDNAAIVWHIAPSGDYWTIYSADAEAYAASTGAKNKAQMLADGTDDKAMWTVSGNEIYEFVNKQNDSNGVNANLRKNGTYGFACYSTSTGGALSLYKKVELEIEGYGNSTGGYYLIASPVTVDPATVEGMTEGNFDLYYFDQAEDNEWQNYKDNDETGHFNLVPGKGYLYAHKTDVTLTFTGTPYNGEPIILSKTDGNGIDWPGWNLVGNPYGVMAYLDRDFYTMNSDGDEIVAATNRSVEALEGVFVIANSNGEELTFSTEAPAASGEKIVVNVSNTNGKLLDRAMIRFGEGGQLPKFQINENSTKLYINEGEEEFAVVRCINESSTPVSFRPAENGTYTLSINTENVEMEYLHLIDNFTGADIDLLATPSYTFESNTTDNVDRFAVVYTATTSVNENNAKPFAFFNGSEWVIMNEGNATMQVVDVTGRVISTETLNGNATINLIQVPGVYMIRLVNGNDVKVQKVVVK